MSESWTLIAILVAVAVLPFALLGVVRLIAWVMPATARRLAEAEQHHHRVYWTVVATAYALLGIRHLTMGGGQPLFGLVFLVLGVAAAIKVAGASRRCPRRVERA